MKVFFSGAAGTPSQHVRQFLGDGVGAEEPRRGDAEPGHREGIGERRLASARTPSATPSATPTPSLFCCLQVKCAQYWPQREERDSVFEDTNFKLTFVSEDVKSHYTVRQLELENLSVSVCGRCSGSIGQLVSFNNGMSPDSRRSRRCKNVRFGGFRWSVCCRNPGGSKYAIKAQPTQIKYK